MDGIPLKMPQAAALQEVKDDVRVTVPDYLTILQETEVRGPFYFSPVCSCCLLETNGN